MSIKILQPGLFTTIQDEGRIGYQDLGFSGAGALDLYSLKMAQSLIGNEGPAIEYTVIGPKIQFLKENSFTFIGGTSNAKLNNKSIDSQVVYHVDNNDILEIGQISEGARGYLVFGHPLKIEKIANSYSTHTRSGLGGFKGRALKKGDIIPIQNNELYTQNVGKAVDYQPIAEDRIIHVIKGPQFNSFSEEAVKSFINSEFKISEQSDRMGYRLSGPSVAPIQSADIISEPVALGSIQVPNDGNPIILLNDKQTVGGYTKIATVTQLDLRKLSQLKPGESIQFEWISIEDVYQQLLEFESSFEQKIKNITEQPLFNLNNVRNTSKKLASLIKEGIMNIEKIEEIINLVKSNDVKKFKYKDFENEIELDFTEGTTQGSPQNSTVQSSDVTQVTHQGQDNENQAHESSDAKEIKSSMVGTFFLQDSKELTDPQIKVGDQVKEGDIVGYIEAMKVMNEVTSDVTGEVTEILVEHGTNVEYDQVLVKVK